MPKFKVVLIEHGYASIKCERQIIESTGAEFIDADQLPLNEGLRLCEDADGILCRRLQVNAKMIKGFRRCKMIVRYGVGTDNVDVNAATAAGIIVGHVPNYCIDEVSTHAIALLLACVRHIIPTHQKMERGEWDVHRGQPIYRLEGRTLGLVGLGNIGQAVARKLHGWGLSLLAADPFVDSARAQSLGVKLVQLETLCRESDYISLHCPLLPETRHLMNSKTIALMKRGAILVNTARGPIVDLKALQQKLDDGHLAAAGLDVFEEEPLPADSPLRKHPRIVASDHTAWYSEEAQLQLQQTAGEEMARVCRGGLPLALANPEVLHRLGRFEEWIPTEAARWQLKRLQMQALPR
jgi:D-3-phosphoglycerate dehydrogenase